MYYFILFLISLNIAYAETILTGQIHGSIDYVNNGEHSAFEINSNESRFAIESTEQFNKWIKTTFRAESRFSFSTGNPDNDDLEENELLLKIGIETPFGRVIIGQTDTPFKLIGRRLDLFGDQVGDARILTRFPIQTSNDARPTDFDAIPSKRVLGYTTPIFKGFSASYFRSVEEGECNDEFNIVDFSISYERKKLYLTFGYELQERGPGGLQPEGFRIGGSYQFKRVKLLGLIQNTQNIEGIEGNEGYVYGIGALYVPNQKNRFKFQFYTAINDIDQGNGNLFAIGWERFYSPNTKVYLAYGYTDNDENVVYGTDYGDNIQPIAGNSFQIISIGIVHSF